MRKLVVLAIVGLVASTAVYADRGGHDRFERNYNRGNDLNRWELSVTVDHRLELSKGQERKYISILAEADYAIRRIRFDRDLSPFDKREAIDRVLANRDIRIERLLSRKQYQKYISLRVENHPGHNRDMGYKDRRDEDHDFNNRR